LSQGKIVTTQVENVTPTEFSWGQVRWLYHGHLAADAETTFGVVTIQAGEETPAHAHTNCEELMYLLKGRLTHRVGDDSHEVAPGTLIRIPRNIKHSAANEGDDTAVMIVCYSAPRRETTVERKPAPVDTADAG
jgi:quercetin dioxygenase-like cupin family protein